MIVYGFTKKLDNPFEETVEKVSEKLKEEGFGIITKINLKEKFKEKLGIDFKNYVILGACNPPSAYEAIQAEENIGLMLPCNVIVYGDKDKTIVSAIKPTIAMEMIENKKLIQIAEKIEGKLKHVIEEIK